MRLALGKTNAGWFRPKEVKPRFCEVCHQEIARGKHRPSEYVKLRFHAGVCTTTGRRPRRRREEAARPAVRTETQALPRIFPGPFAALIRLDVAGGEVWWRVSCEESHRSLLAALAEGELGPVTVVGWQPLLAQAA